VTSANSRRAYRGDLAAFEAWRAGRPLTRLLVEAYAARLREAGYSPYTINRALSAVRWWARRLADLAYENPQLERGRREEILAHAKRVADIQNVKGSRLSKGRHVADGELAALMQVCGRDASPAGVRDAALIAVAWTTGARRAELAGLALADYSLEEAGDAGDLTIRGKGDRERVAYLYGGAAAAISDWLLIREEQPGPLFCPIWKSGKVRRGEGLTGAALRKMLAKRAGQAKLSKSLTWHDFRRTFAGNLLDAGHDLSTVQKLLGHASPMTTGIYDRRGEAVKRKAVRSLHVPYHRHSFVDELVREQDG